MLFFVLIVIEGKQNCKHGVSSVVDFAAGFLINLKLPKQVIKLAVFGISHSGRMKSMSEAMELRIAVSSHSNVP